MNAAGLDAELIPTVGMEGRLQIVLPGPEVETKPVDKRAPVLVRIAGLRPHGTLISYDIRYVGLEPGEYDLRDFLRTKDGATAQHLPPLKVRTTGLLPKPHSGWLVPEAGGATPLFSNYRILITAVALLWLGLAIPLYFWWRPKRADVTVPKNVAPPTLADRLRPLVEAALRGELSSDGQAQLERLLINYWRERLGLQEMTYAAVLLRLKSEPEPARVLQQVEEWLHRPPGSVRVDLHTFLEPYRTSVTQEAGATEPPA